MFSLHYSDGQGQWIAKYRRHDQTWGNKRLPKHLQRHQQLDAERAFLGWFAEYSKGQTVSNQTVSTSKPKAITLRLLADRWLEYRRTHKGTAPNTYRGYRYSFNNWVLDNPAFNHASIESLDIEAGELSVAILLEWIRSLKGSPRHKLTICQALQVMLDDAIALEWLNPDMANPMSKPGVRRALADLRSQATNRAVIAHLSLEQCRALLTQPHKSIEDIRRLRYLIALTQGLRISEIQALTFEDIDLQSNTLTVNKQLLKRGSAPLLHSERDLSHLSKDQLRTVPNAVATPAKSRASHRMLPLHSLTAAALTWWRDWGYEHHTGQKPSPKAALFPKGKHRPDHGAPTYFANPLAYDLIRKDLMRVGVSDSYTDPLKGITVALDFHSLRHTFAHLLEMGGTDEGNISMLLGHSGKSVARTHYLARHVENARRHIESIDLQAVRLGGELIVVGAETQGATVIPMRSAL